ncbi:DUF2101 family protein [Thermococcus camini]|uniref:DUF2101 domain-containing protein n=1 Tax=Thermococcus camini TaxID=2016373 RepID=A0A7G2D684_9EURY|nr:DUF2101 family protein [Thermococcus camini]CAD5243404.1 conserved membrane protein of unknown function [Thermococcus camini]
MGLEDFLYRIGESVYSAGAKVRGFLFPTSGERPPNFSLMKRLTKKPLTVHEFLSLRLQVAFLLYLFANLAMLLLRLSPIWIAAVGAAYVVYLRYTLLKNRDFFIDPQPYRTFYYGISAVTLAAFLGYTLVRRVATSVYYYYGYLLVVFAAVMAFRWYFKERYGRDYTYGVVEEIKGDVVRVFVHDDIAANVKPGHYWVDAVEDLEVGRVVKLVVEDRKLKGAVPVRIIEVYLTDQSSQTSTEPKEEAE